ncbi:hypothetical protein [Aeromonas sp.]|uniref:hypothetical protein n=1 Tax=Aeromonas TaxID=642 RepID=UPI002583AEE1|nr:hypothetical protein [Aeromonas sp.]MCX7128286.1 hypothetical protein [Aeromonas sp.]
MTACHSPIKTALLIFRCFVLLAVGLLAYNSAPMIPKQSISGLLDALLSVSGLLFAVFGAWLSLLANNMFSIVNSQQSTIIERNGEVDKAEMLVSPMTAAAAMVVVGISVKCGIVFLDVMELSQNAIFFLKREVVFIISVCAFYQVWCIFSAVNVGVQFVLNLEKLSRKRAVENR